MATFFIGFGVGAVCGPVVVYFVKLGYQKLKEKFGPVS